MMGRKKRRRAGGFGSEVFVCLFVCDERTINKCQKFQRIS
jgi:hypothetical protein